MPPAIPPAAGPHDAPFDAALLDRRAEWEDQRRASRRTDRTRISSGELPAGVALSDSEREWFHRADLVETLLDDIAGEPLSGDPPALPGFVLLTRLGDGGMGEVWLGTDLTLDRPVAVKFPHRQFSPGPLASRFEREGRALARLRHENIVAVHEAGVAGESPYLVMEYVPGGTLDDLLGELPGAPRRAAALIAAAARAVHHAHEHGVVHRDLKPSNLFVAADGTLRVGDFGVAALLADWIEAPSDRLPVTDATPLALPRLTRADSVIGTPPFVAPEAYQGGAAARPESDVWSLGVILYLTTTGLLPFDGAPNAVRAGVLTADPPPPRTHRPAIPHWLEAVILRCLAKDPAARFRTAAALADALDAGIAADRRTAARQGRIARFAVGATAAALLATLVAVAVMPESPAKRYARVATAVARDLAAGKSVELVTPGKPAPATSVVVNPTFVNVGRDADGNAAFDAVGAGAAMIEFLPAVAGDFHLSVTLRQTHANRADPSVSLYACGATNGDGSRDCVQLRTTDLGQHATVAGPGGQLGSCAQLLTLRHWPDPVRFAGVWQTLSDPDRAVWRMPNDGWRRLELSVREGTVLASLDGAVLPPESLAGFRRLKTQNGLPLRLEPDGAVGLIVDGCKVSVRNFTLTPLPKDQRPR